MMSPDLETWHIDVVNAEQRLYEVECVYGKTSSEYQQALGKFARLWFVMKMRRKPEEFLPDRKVSVG